MKKGTLLYNNQDLIIGILIEDNELKSEERFYFIEEEFILPLDMDNLRFDEHSRPYEQTSEGKLYLSRRTPYDYEIKN
jgi:hypothetical protein